MISRHVCSALVTAVLVISSVTPAAAQVLYGSIVGTVRDSSDAAVPNATVQITNTATNQSRNGVANNSGEFSFPSLEPGTYDVNVSAPGFQTSVTKGVRAEVDVTARVNSILKVGTASETVTVTADDVSLQTDSAEVRGDISSKELEDMPVPANRNFESLLLEIPGITPPEDQNSGAANPSRGLGMSASGTPRNMNNIRIDGASANNVWLPYVAGYIPGLDAIETVSVVTGNMDVSQGLAGGVAVNVHIKSGGNQLHGSAFFYQMNSAFSAEPFYPNPSNPNPKNINNVGGGTIGGPIRKDKLFYFLSYDGHFQGQNAQATYTVPTPEMRAGNFSLVTKNAMYDPLTGNADGTGRTAFVGNIIPTSRLDPIALKMQGHVALPNYGSATTTTNNYFATGDASQQRSTTDAKVDYRPMSKLNIANRFGWLHYELFNPDAYGDNGAALSSSISRPGNVFGNIFSTTSNATYILSPTMVVDGFFSVTTQGTSAEPQGFGVKQGLDYLGIPGTNGPTSNYSGWPYFNITNYSTIGTAANSGGGPLFYNDRQFQYGLNTSWSKGTHNVRFGAELGHQAYDHFEQANGFNGQFAFTGGPTALKGGSSTNQFNNYASFLLGMPTTIYHDFLPFGNLRSYQNIYGLYAQDAWRVNGKLSVSAGVRWSRFPLATRDNGRGLERFDFATGLVELCGVGSAPRDCGYHVSNLSFSPNIGIAYQVTNTLVVRSGFGMNYDPAPLAYNRDMLSNYPEILAFTFAGPNTYQPAIKGLAQGIPPLVAPDITQPYTPLASGYNINTLRPDLKRDYVLTWNFTVQKELPKGFFAQAGYVASRGVGIPQLMNQNIAQLGGGTTGEAFYNQYGSATLNVAMPINHTHYDSLQTQLMRRFGSAHIRAAYTFSKNTGLCCNDISDTAPAIELPQYQNLNRAVEPQDRTNVFTLSGDESSPFGKGGRWLTHGFAGRILGGWSLRGIASMYSGKPFNVTGSTTPLNSNGVSTQRPDLIDPTVATLGGIGPGQLYFNTKAFAAVNTARIGTAGYDILRGPGAKNLDASLVREFSILERFKLQFRADAYNLTNTPHFAAPNGSITSSGFGQITATVSNQREGQDQRTIRLGAKLRF
jgi:hypothetical protein